MAFEEWKYVEMNESRQQLEEFVKLMTDPNHHKKVMGRYL